MKKIITDIKWEILCFKRKIKNLIRWFPIIWKDRDYGDYYILKILKFKLSNQAEYISKSYGHTRAQYDASRMRLCVRLIEKIQSEYYQLEYMNYFKDRFEFRDSVNHPNCKELHITNISNNFEEYVVKHYSTYKKVIKEHYCKDSKSTALKMSYEVHQKAKRILFELLNIHLESWWD